jgi:hypothetical protein
MPDHSRCGPWREAITEIIVAIKQKMKVMDLGGVIHVADRCHPGTRFRTVSVRRAG